MAGKTTVYREEERNFSAGDRVVALKNDREIGVQNGSLGVLRRFDEEGHAVVQFGKKEKILDLSRYRHLDHAYAVTLHKSQGATVEHSILYAPVRPAEGKILSPDDGGKSYARASYNALNVAVTRAQFGTSIFTNSLPGLAREVEHLDRKSSSLDPLPKREMKTASVREPGAKPPLQEMPGPGHPPPAAATTGGDEKGRERAGNSPEVAGKTEAPSVQIKESRMLEKDHARGPSSSGRGSSNPAVPAREKFDRGAKFGKRVDELARAGAPAQRSINDLLQNLGRPLPGVAKEIAKQVPRIPVKGIGMDIDI